MEGDWRSASSWIALRRISIHSLRMEGDSRTKSPSLMLSYFNPLPPYGGRHTFAQTTNVDTEFQSTPSVWRETAAVGTVGKMLVRISIHSLRMEGDLQYVPCYHLGIISIHSLRMEGDGRKLAEGWKIETFQSTPSVWRETRKRLLG